MKIELKEITIRDLTAGYKDSIEDGVTAFGGNLDVRPKYQREFIYKEKQRDAVIASVQKDFPLNTMYWSVQGNNKFEIIDGQQRTISICQYVNGDFAYDKLYFHNLQDDQQEQILDYKVMVYHCSGKDSERLEWFKIINIAGEKLTDQELRNAVYAGSWLTDAKRYFSKQSCPAYNIANVYLTGSSIRQEYLETAIKWISNGQIEKYMSSHQREVNANELWLYFQEVINWVKIIFPHYRKEMKGVPYGSLYNDFKDKKYDANELEKEIKTLMEDRDVTKKSGIYQYVLTRDSKYLSLRAFDDKQKREAFENQAGICVICKKEFKLEEMEADHITPWSKGGKTIDENCQMLCKACNRSKAGS